MQRKSDWKLTGWRMEDPAGAPPSTAHDGVPVVRFDRDCEAVLIGFDRTGELREIRFRGQALTPEGLRHVRVGELIEKARRHLEGHAAVRRYQHGYLSEVLATDPDPNHQENAAALLDAVEVLSEAEGLQGFQRPAYVGGPRKPDYELAMIAFEYVYRCVDRGEKVSAVAKSMGIPQATLSTQIQSARKRGLLDGEPQRGKAVGALTEKAKEILKELIATYEREGQL